MTDIFFYIRVKSRGLQTSRDCFEFHDYNVLSFTEELYYTVHVCIFGYMGFLNIRTSQHCVFCCPGGWAKEKTCCPSKAGIYGRTADMFCEQRRGRTVWGRWLTPSLSSVSLFRLVNSHKHRQWQSASTAHTISPWDESFLFFIKINKRF